MILRVTVLGFSGAAPLLGACPAYVVSDGRRTVLLDCGPGAVERLERFNLLGELDAIVISHTHADHVLDLLMLAGEVTRGRLGPGRPSLYVPAGGAAFLAGFDAAFSDAPRERTRFDETFEVMEYSPADEIDVGEMHLSFAPTVHRGLCCAARVTSGEASVVYGADGAPSAAVEELAFETDLLMLEATYADDAEEAAQHGHMTAVQAGEMAGTARAKRLVLTHLLPGADASLLRLAERGFDGEVALAREGLTYELP